VRFFFVLYFRNNIRRQKQRQVSSSSVTRVVTNVENRCFKITYQLLKVH